MQSLKERIRKTKNSIAEIHRYKRIYGDKIHAMKRLPELKKKLKELRRKLQNENKIK